MGNVCKYVSSIDCAVDDDDAIIDPLVDGEYGLKLLLISDALLAIPALHNTQHNINTNIICRYSFMPIDFLIMLVNGAIIIIFVDYYILCVCTLLLSYWLKMMMKWKTARKKAQMCEWDRDTVVEKIIIYSADSSWILKKCRAQNLQCQSYSPSSFIDVRGRNEKIKWEKKCCRRWMSCELWWRIEFIVFWRIFIVVSRLYWLLISHTISISSLNVQNTLLSSLTSPIYVKSQWTYRKKIKKFNTLGVVRRLRHTKKKTFSTTPPCH